MTANNSNEHILTAKTFCLTGFQGFATLRARLRQRNCSTFFRNCSGEFCLSIGPNRVRLAECVLNLSAGRRRN